ncbi:Uncharacterised protein [Chlamydia trachomatis]|nr:Uncharacterised protein [Chlamydia trachomatis]
MPYAKTSTTPPSVSAFAFASSIRATMRASASLSRVRTGEASNASTSSGVGRGKLLFIYSPPIPITCATVRTPNAWCKNASATAPKATRETVSLALERSKTSRASLKPYLRMPVKSACPGRGLESGALRPSTLKSWSNGSALITSTHFGHSLFAISIAIGDPRVTP